jgi:hypothetical protein
VHPACTLGCPMASTDTSIRTATAVVVSGVAGCAARISYTHIRDLALAHGQHGADAVMLPLAVDGLVLASGLSMLHEARAGRRSLWLAWLSLGAGIGATLSANLAYGARFGIVGALISAWPAVAFVMAAELLMLMVRRPRPDRKAPSRKADRNAHRNPVTVPAMSNGHSAEVHAFADYLERGEVPGVRVIKSRLSCAQPRATQVREQIREVLAGSDAR